MQKKLIIILFVVTAAILQLGCNIFDTRDAESPEQPRDNYETAYTPDILIDNLINSLRDKNTQNYLASFSDSNFSSKEFIFDPSAGSALQFPELLNDWNKNNEESYLINIFSRMNEGELIQLELTNEDSNPFGDSLIYSASYFLNVPHNDAENPVEFRGDLKFKLIRDSRLIWTIHYWQDIKSSDYPTWSELKGLYY
jgi:hypothetical protein